MTSPWGNIVSGRCIYFGSYFQRIQPEVAWLCFWSYCDQNEHHGGGTIWQGNYKCWCVISKGEHTERMLEKAVTPRNTLPLTYFIQVGANSQQHNHHMEFTNGLKYLLCLFSPANIWRWPYTHIKRYVSWISQVFLNLIRFTVEINCNKVHLFLTPKYHFKPQCFTADPQMTSVSLTMKTPPSPTAKVPKALAEPTL